jgi:hypothetical protein
MFSCQEGKTFNHFGIECKAGFNDHGGFPLQSLSCQYSQTCLQWPPLGLQNSGPCT